MQDVQSPHSIGTVLCRRYVVVNVLGKGGFGAVYLVRDKQNKPNLYALKELVNPSKAERQQFAFEAELLSRLQHPALPHVYGFFDDEKQNRSYMLMNYVEGLNLKVLQLQQPEHRFTVQRVLTIMAPIMVAVTYLHFQQPPIIHRDIKPSNIIVPKAGDATVLVDFGIAKEYDTDSTTAAIRHCTPGYGAPEQYSGGTDTRTDVYALGATFYTLLTGIIPPDALHRSMLLGCKEPDPLTPLDLIVPTVPAAIVEAVHRALSISRQDRFATVEQFWQALNVDSIAQQVQEQQLDIMAGEAPALLAPSLPEPQVPSSISPDQDPIAHKKANRSAAVSSREPLLKHSFKRRVRLLPISLMCLAVLLAIAGVEVNLLYTTSRYHSGSALPTSGPQQMTTQSPVPGSTVPANSIESAGYPSIAISYSGTIHTISGNATVTMSLTGIQQQQGNISGYFSGLSENGRFRGTITTSGHIQFAVTSNTGQTTLTFNGVMQLEGNLTGTYCKLSQAGQCSDYGIWNVSPG